MSFFRIVFLALFLANSSCSSKALLKAKRHQLLREKAYSLVEEDLKANLKKGTYLWAATKAKSFVNGAKVRVGKQVLKYSFQGAKNWQDRLHIVDATVEIYNKKSRTQLDIKYTYKEADSWKIELRREFVYGFPSELEYVKNNWISSFSRNKKLLRALRERKVYVGMSENHVLLSLGEPAGKEEVTSSVGVSKKYIYKNKIIYILNGKVAKQEFN